MSYDPRAMIINIHHHFRETVWYSQTSVGSATGQTRMGILVPSLTSPHSGQSCRNSGVTVGQSLRFLRNMVLLQVFCEYCIVLTCGTPFQPLSSIITIIIITVINQLEEKWTFVIFILLTPPHPVFHRPKSDH